MRRISLLAMTAIALAGCRVAATPTNAPDNAAPAAGAAELTLTRLDCGHGDFKDMNGFFSDRPGVYPPGPGRVTDSCYLIRHGNQQMVWDTGFPASSLTKPIEQDGMVAKIDRTLADQLAEVGLKPTDIDVLGISHMHSDHTGQAAQFTNARLVIGQQDFAMTAGKDDPFGPWRGAGKPVTELTGDQDVFGDGSVVALHLPGHTPDHLALLVNLKSGPVLLTGDVYHSRISRQKRSMPGFNTSRAETLASMEKFEALAKKLGAKVIIQHEPADIAKLPPFPAAAK
ncbi:MAG: N-acyl homoserine lactonase family protein [Sphingomicrobium sp.]